MASHPSRDLGFEISLYESVAAGDPDNVEALMALGEACTRQGDFAKGLEVDRRLSKLRPRDPVVQYNLACSLSLTGNRAEALDALMLAVDLGYRDARHLDADRDLDGLREDPRFEAIRERLRSGAGSA